MLTPEEESELTESQRQLIGALEHLLELHDLPQTADVLAATAAANREKADIEGRISELRAKERQP